MNKISFLSFLVFFIFISSAQAQVSLMLPDLVVEEFKLSSVPTFVGRDRNAKVRVPVKAVIRNRGNADAGSFKIAAFLTEGGILPFNARGVFGESSLRFPHISAGIPAGNEITVFGNILITRSKVGRQISIKVDSCAEEEVFSPTIRMYCYVTERNEGNNTSGSITVNRIIPDPQWQRGP